MEIELNNWSFHCGYKEKMDRIEFGKKARNIREKLGLSLEEMAKRMFISMDALHRIEHGYVSPEPYLISRLKRVQKIQYIRIAV